MSRRYPRCVRLSTYPRPSLCKLVDLDMRAILGIAVGAFVLGSGAVAIGDSPEARRVTGTVTRVHCPSGHVSVRDEGRDVDLELRRARAPCAGIIHGVR